MVSNATKDAVWSGLLESARVSRYFSAIADKHHKRKHWREIVSALAGVFATISFVFEQLHFLIPFAAGCIILTSLFDRFWPNQVSLVSSVDSDLASIATKYDSLFRDANSDQIDESTVKYAKRLLDESIDKACDRVDIPYDEELAGKIQSETFEVEGSKFAHNVG